MLVAYGRALDKRDFAAYGALFAKDRTWKGGMGSATSPEAIAKMVEAGFGRMSPSLYESSNHVMTSFEIAVDGDAAAAWSRWMWVVVGANGKPQTERAGHYEDVLVREDGRWKFKSRQAFYGDQSVALVRGVSAPASRARRAVPRGARRARRRSASRP